MNKWYHIPGTMQFRMQNFGSQVKEIVADIESSNGYSTEVLLEVGSEAEAEAIKLGGVKLN